MASALLALSACGTSHAVDELPDATMTPASLPEASSPALEKPQPLLCERWAALQCQGEARCCSDPSRDQDACVQALQASCEQQLQLDEIAKNPISGYDADDADRKFDALQQLIATCDVSVARWTLSPSGLRGMLHGTLAQGQSCKPADVVTADRATLAAAVVACSDAEHVACLPASLLGEWTCASKQDDGASCLTDENCGSASHCDNPEQNPLGTCAPALPLMAACTSASQCASSACVEQRCVELDVQSAYCPSES
jgi:Dickkopf N-terminal cysteine-rich region